MQSNDAHDVETTRSGDFDSTPYDQDQVSLCEALDRVLNKGAVLVGEVMISVADIDLVYLGLQLVLTSIESGRDLGMMSFLAGSETETRDGAQ
jgi:hypothetical protein